MIDDEPPARKKVRSLLADDGRVDVVGEAEDGISAVTLIESERPDLAFLDVQMPELDGFGVLEALEPPLPRIVFVTAHDDFAVKAFEAAAVDYLLKPVERERFRVALDRALATADDGLAAVREHVAAHRPLTRLLVRRANRMLLVAIESVDWLEAARNYVRVHTGGDAHLVRSSLTELETRLDPEVFVRVHRSAIVNLDAVDRFEPLSHGDWRVVLRGGGELRLSRRYRERLESLLGA
ncbi:MAG: LytTR family DNA-binding domain-containing protein [Gemmatimonadota bacterium]|nr:LytTR family DNA-binding domain-containing protein [Gemmatimonadota bacterium]